MHNSIYVVPNRNPVQAMDSDWLSDVVRKAATERSLKPGQILFRTGNKTAGLYEIAEGRVRLVRVDRSGREALLQVAGPGETLAEASLFSSIYHCDAIATTAARVRLYPKSVLLNELDRDPKAARGFTAMLARQVITLRVTTMKQFGATSADHGGGKRRRLFIFKPAMNEIKLIHFCHCYLAKCRNFLVLSQDPRLCIAVKKEKY
jgi:CRP-like cAMP-binding protein